MGNSQSIQKGTSVTITARLSTYDDVADKPVAYAPRAAAVATYLRSSAFQKYCQEYAFSGIHMRLNSVGVKSNRLMLSASYIGVACSVDDIETYIGDALAKMSYSGPLPRTPIAKLKLGEGTGRASIKIDDPVFDWVIRP